MTTKLRQVCGFELCITPKDMHIGINRFRTRLVTYLPQNYVGRYTRNSLFSTTSAAHYKDKLFLYGEFLYSTIKYYDWCITCLPIKPNNIIHIKCALCFCD